MAIDWPSCVVLCYKGEFLHKDLADFDMSDNIGVLGCEDFPDPGLWAWEGIPKRIMKDMGNESCECLTFDKAGWRRLTDEEAIAVGKGKFPWGQKSSGEEKET